MVDFKQGYKTIQNGGVGFYNQNRGFFEVSGSEAVRFLNGLITNDIEKLKDGAQMLAAFPTLKGRMFAVVRVIRKGKKFLFETEEETRRKVYDNLFRFTFAGDFHLTDLSDDYEYFSIFGDLKKRELLAKEVFKFQNDYLVAKGSVEQFRKLLGWAVEISDELYEILRIENGIPKYGIDMDEGTVVPEIGFDGMISYKKGCYLGQEVIARIHFRGKVAKQLMGLVFEEGDVNFSPGDEIKSLDDKSAGKVTSVTFSLKLGKTIALAFVRNVFLEEGTKLKVRDHLARVVGLPFI